jgi:hypothetical protein
MKIENFGLKMMSVVLAVLLWAWVHFTDGTLNFGVGQ